MPQKSRKEELTSYLSTTELLELTGISRKALRVYERDGICEPARVESDYYKYWTLDQASMLKQVNELSRSGVPMKEVATVVEEGGDLAEISLKTNAALAPEDGYVLVASRLPGARFEFQALVRR